jgi:dTDP-4-amino-4,6-dideoxygalactose transaminase
MAPYAGFSRTALPVAEVAATEILSLPLSPHMDTEQVKEVCGHVNAITAGSGRR